MNFLRLTIFSGFLWIFSKFFLNFLEMKNVKKGGQNRRATRTVLTWQCGPVEALARSAQTHVGAYVAHRVSHAWSKVGYWAIGIVDLNIA